MSTPTPKQILQKAPQLRDAVNTMLLAKAKAQAIRKRIDKMDRAILSERVFNVRPEFADLRPVVDERILDPKITYLMSDADMEIYDSVRNRLIEEMGFQVPKGYCPALMAESALNEAERAVVAAAAPITGIADPDDIICQQKGLEKFDKMVDLLSRLIVSMPGYEAPAIPQNM